MVLDKAGLNLGKEIIAWTRTGGKSWFTARPVKVNTSGLRLADDIRECVEFTLNNGKKARVYKIGKDDLPFLERLSTNIEKFMDSVGIAPREVNDNRMIIETTINVMKEKLQLLPREVKTHLLIAESEGKLCGALAGGLPKKTPLGETLYSSRKGALNNETELNWLAAWPQGNGIGKILLSEFINTIPKDGFKKMFIQSEIPKFSNASKFYERMGFRKLYKTASERPVSEVEYNKDILPCLSPDAPNMYDYSVIPMLGKNSVIQKIINSIFSHCKREAYITSSINLNTFIS